MRKILFRGVYPNKNSTTEITLNGEKIKGEWVVGSLLWQGKGKAYIITHDCDFGSVAFCEECAVPYDASYGDCGSQFEVIPETVGEYTDFCDKNGKPIFEGDIMLVDVKKEATPKSNDRHITKASVEFQNGGFTLGGGELVLFTYYGLKFLFKPSSFSEYEVIGNIHENPDVFGVPVNNGGTEQ